MQCTFPLLHSAVCFPNASQCSVLSHCFTVQCNFPLLHSAVYFPIASQCSVLSHFFTVQCTFPLLHSAVYFPIASQCSVLFHCFTVQCTLPWLHSAVYFPIISFLIFRPGSSTKGWSDKEILAIFENRHYSMLPAKYILRVQFQKIGDF